MTPEAARHLRALYRGNGGERAYPLVRAEADRLGVPREDLPHILVSAWKEGRELDGQRKDYTLQAWVDENGERMG